jgi:UMF1 family MFS transporter
MEAPSDKADVSFDRSTEPTLQPGVRKREVFGWAMYDFANSGYTTVVITAVFSAYFVGSVAGGQVWATLAWTLALSISYAVVMLTMPLWGAWCDRHAAKKRLLAFTTLACVLSTAALMVVQPGDVLLGLVLIVVSNTFFSYGESLIAAFLPGLARPSAMGRVSGWGWSFGYVGGMLCLGLCLAYVLQAQQRSEPASAFVPVTMGMTAVYYGLASLFTFALLRERSIPQPALSESMTPTLAWKRLRRSLCSLSDYPELARLLVCIVAYQAGVAVAITLAAIYAEQVMGFQPQETMVLIFALNIAAALGALVLGHAQDRWGHQQTLALTLVGWVLTCLMAALAQSKTVFWGAAVLAGLCLGSSQSSGRAMAGMLIPVAKSAEFFGLWGFAVRLASIVGPLLYGLITWMTVGNQRLAIGSTGVLFLLGLWLLGPLDMARGRARAQEADRGSAAPSHSVTT